MRIHDTHARLAPLCLLALGVLLLSSLPARGEIQRQFQLQGQQLVLANLAGSIQIIPSQGDEFQLEVTVRGKDAQENLLRFEENESSTRSTFIVRFPLDREHDYVYPPMGPKSNTKFRYDPEHVGDHSFLRQLFGSGGTKVSVRGKGKGMEVWADLTLRIPQGKSCEVYLGAGAIDARDLHADLSLDTHSGRITVEGLKGDFSADTGTGMVSISAVQGKAEIDTGSGSVTASEVAGDLAIDTGTGSVTASKIDGDLAIDTGSGSVTASEVAGDLAIDTGTGSVRVQAVKGEKVKVDTGSGSIRVEKLQCKNLSLDTGTGSVEGKELKCENIAVDTGAGRVELAEVGTDSAKIDTGTGGISLQLERMGRGNFTLDAGSGEIEFTLPDRASARIAAETLSGRIQLERADGKVEDKSKQSAVIVVGEGEAQVSLETANGGISIR